MSEELDRKVLALISDLLEVDQAQAASLVQRLWKERQVLVDALQRIRTWDLTHSEALGVQRVQEIIEVALIEAGEPE